MGKVVIRLKLDEELWRRTKAKALLRNKNVSELVEEILRKEIQKSEKD